MARPSIQTSLLQASGAEAPESSSSAAPRSRNQGAFYIDSIVSFAAPGEQDSIVIRNYGPGTGNLTGFRLTDSDTRAPGYVFGQTGCASQAIVRSGDSVRVSQRGANNTCGFSFNLGIADEVNLFDSEGRVVSRFEWNTSRQGYAFYR